MAGSVSASKSATATFIKPKTSFKSAATNTQQQKKELALSHSNSVANTQSRSLKKRSSLLNAEDQPSHQQQSSQNDPVLLLSEDISKTTIKSNSVVLGLEPSQFLLPKGQS